MTQKTDQLAALDKQLEGRDFLKRGIPHFKWVSWKTRRGGSYNENEMEK
jgi:hypothetical protein